MPFLDWVNKNQAVGAANAVPYHLLQLVQNFGDAASTINSQPIISSFRAIIYKP